LHRRAWLLAAPALAGQIDRRGDRRDERLPDGRSQLEEILKAEHRQSLEDASELLDLAEQLKMELEKNDRHVVSVASIRKTEQIEKLAKRIRARLKRY
jgi:hypothetical protein